MRAIRLALAAVMLAPLVGARPTAVASPDRAALDDIVGSWMSDTTDGIWTRSTCAPTPQGGGVVCEQTIMTPGGVRHAVNLFLVDSAAGHYVYYGVNQPGSVVQPTALEIANHVWIYGGRTKAPDGRYYRTVNDFTGHDSYTWRAETSGDGAHWTAGAHGRSLRQR